MTTLYTPAVHKALFQDTERMADVMLGSLVVAVATAAVFGLHQVEKVVSASLKEASFFDGDTREAEKVPPALQRRAKRCAARERFDAVMARRAAKLEVPALLEKADFNPVQWQLTKGEEASRAQERLSATARRTGGAGPSRPKRSSLVTLNFSRSALDEQAPTQLQYVDRLHRHLQKSKNVRRLLPEKL